MPAATYELYSLANHAIFLCFDLLNYKWGY